MIEGSVVIVGAGQAGFQAAASLRHEGFLGSIALVGDEIGLPYLRPPLSKAYLLGRSSVDELAFRPQDFFDENRIELVRGRVTSLDRGRKHVELDSGAALPYDRLVLATGAIHRRLTVPGAELDGVFTLRTLHDADRLRERLRPDARVVVVGAGFIGLEFAAVARSLGASVDVLELGSRAMARVVSEHTSAFYRELHTGLGVRLHFGVSVTSIEGPGGQVVGVALADGAVLPADIVLVGVGATPDTALAEAAGLEVANGVRVDASLTTSDPDIVAVGDCAAFPRAGTGELIRLESVQNAADQARAVAATIVNGAPAAEAVPWFWTDQYHLKLQIAGLSAGHDAAVVVGEPGSQSFTVMLFRAGTLIATESVGRNRDFIAGRRLLAAGRGPSLDEATAEGFDLADWSKQGART